MAGDASLETSCHIGHAPQRFVGRSPGLNLESGTGSLGENGTGSLVVRNRVLAGLESGLVAGCPCHGDMPTSLLGVLLNLGFCLNTDKWLTAFRRGLTTTRKDLCQVLAL